MMKTSQDEKVKESVWLWFTQQREKGMPLSGTIIQEKDQKNVGKIR